MIQVIGRALDIIELIAKEPEEVKTLSDIADTIGLNHGTCANILKTLVNRNYVEKVGGKKGYKLGMMAFRLAGRKDYKNDLVEAAKEEMTRLTKQFNENTLLSVLKENKRLAILRVNSHHQLQVVTPTEKDAYNSSTGRLLVAMLPDDELEAFIKKHSLPPSRPAGKAVAEKKFYDEVKKIRKEGFATYLPDDQILGLAVPVYQESRVVASLSMYLPAFRCNNALKKQMKESLIRSAQKISNKLKG